MASDRVHSLRSGITVFLASIALLPSIGFAQSLDRPPEIAAPDTVTGVENSLITFQATALDPDGDPMVHFFAGSVPLGASFVTDSTNTSGTFSYAPGYFDRASYEILLSASSARRPSEVSSVAGPLLTATKTVYLRIANLDRPPVLRVPDHVTGAENTAFGFGAHGSDPDGDPVTVTMSELPAGATARSFGSSAEFTWAPQTGQAGDYSVAVTARSADLYASEIVPMTVMPNQLPVLEGPAQVDGKENELVTFQVHAYDPDGDLVVLSAGFVPGDATFTVEPGSATGTFSWTPGFRDAGERTVRLSARSSVRADPVSGPIVGYQETTLLTRVLIANTDRPPAIPPLAEQVVDEGSTLRKEFYVIDPDGDPVELSLRGPEFAQLEQECLFLGICRAVLVLAPGYQDAGTYTESEIRAVAGEGSATAPFLILVRDRNAPPLVAAPERISGTEGSPLAFDVSASDPDGEALILEMREGPAGSDFVDHGDRTGTFAWTPTSGQAGEHPARFLARDSHDLASEPATVWIHVAEALFEAHAFLEAADEAIRLHSGKPAACVHIEPQADSYRSDAVDLGSIVMRSSDTGSVSEIVAARERTTVGEDRNRNGTVEVTACFMKEDLRLLFSRLSGKGQEVPVTIEGSLLTGGAWRADLEVTVVGSGNGLHVAVTPNPSRPSGVLMVRTSRAGPLTVRLFDVHGRLVKTLAGGEHREAGDHAVSLDGVGPRRGRLTDGVYFYRVITAEGERSGRLIVAR